MKKYSKFLSILLAVTMFVSCFAFQGIVSFAETNVWDGTSITQPKGLGTAESPYLVSNGAELAWMIRNSGHHYSITNDIYLNSVDEVDWQTGEGIEGYTPNSWYSSNQVGSSFNGHIYGNGHVIYGLYIKDTTAVGGRTTGYGLIPVGGNLEIVGLGVDKSYIEAYTNYSCGVFVGNGQGTLLGTIDQCYAGADVTIKGFDVGTIIGGGDPYGENDIPHTSLTISNCYSLATAEGSHLAGMIGDVWTAEYVVKNCYAVGTKITGKGNLTASNNYSTDTVLWATQLSPEKMQGTVFDGNALVLGDTFMATETYPILKVFADEVPAFSGLAEPFLKGDGGASNPYEISTVGQLAHAVARGAGKSYKLVKDIYINDLSKIDWTNGNILDENYIPVQWFSGVDTSSEFYTGFNTTAMKWNGTLDGNGFTVYGLWYPNSFSKTTAGLIPGATSATVKNLGISSSYVVGGRFIGAISSAFAGTAEKIVVDETVTVIGKKNVTVDSYSCSGLFGYGNGITLDNCAFYGTLIGQSHINGLIGTSWGTKVYASNSFSIGYQPFTTSIATKNYATKEDCDAVNHEKYYGDIYKVSNVYTDVVDKVNKVTYRYDSDGIDTDGKDGLEYDVSNTYEVFTFTKLSTSQITGKAALDNMPGVSTDYFHATYSYPRTKNWARVHGDADLDGIEAIAGDYAAIRKAIIGTADTGCTDFDGNGKTDVCDLIKVWYLSPTYRLGEFTYTLKNIENPAEYVIVYKSGDTEAKKAAEALGQAYKEQGVTISVVADTAAVSDKEILVGATNRGLHEEGLDDGKYTITAVGNKIQLSSSTTTPAALSTAVKTYKALSPEGFVAITEGWHEYEGGSVTLAVNIPSKNFKLKEKTFSYVWGDEFYGNTLNTNKWVCTTGSSKMGKYSDLEILSTEEAVKVQNGSLNLTAGQRADGSFFAPASVHTQGTMEYRYGYIEMKAKIPYRQGVWPSFWMQSAATLGGRQCYDYMVEVDMLEVFGHKSDLYCNLHKWYSSAKQEEFGLTKPNIAAAADGSTSNWLTDFLEELLDRHPDLGTEQKTLNNPEDWHTYGFGWDAEHMYMYVDQELFKVYEITNAESVFGEDNVKKTSDEMDGFQDPLYIIFNNHIFTNGSVESHNGWNPSNITGYEATSLPATYEIDYVRLYQGTETNTQLWTK